jgi:hypothetical protein
MANRATRRRQAVRFAILIAAVDASLGIGIVTSPLQARRKI